MNQNPANLSLRSLMTGPEGWGSAAGAAVQRLLGVKLAASGPPGLVRLSLAGVKRVDVTFAAAVISVILQYRGHRALCLTDPVSEDVVGNFAAAASLAEVPVWLWRGELPLVLGPQPTGGLAEVLAWAMARPQVRAGELTKALGLSLANASTRLKKLWEAGYLLREEVVAASGGVEFVYARIG